MMNNEEIKDEELETEAEVETEAEEAAEETRTADPGSDEAPVEMDTPEEPEEKMLTQSQVNELVGRARQEGRESAMRELRERYGVADDNEMNDVFGRGQGYDVLRDEFTGLDGRYRELSAENALLKSKIISTRWDDVKAILNAKGMDVTEQNIAAELATHPEWSGAGAGAPAAGGGEFTPEMAEGAAPIAPMTPKPASQIRKLGSNAPEDNSAELEEEALAKRIFGY